MPLTLLEARRPAEQKALQEEMVRVWSQLEAMDAASTKRVLDAVTTMRQEVLDRLAALPTVTIDQQETFAATSLRQFSAELDEIAGRFQARYSAFLTGDMQDAARMSDAAHRAVLDALARATGVPPSLIVLSPLGLDATQIEAAILLNQSAIRNVSQAVVSAVNREIQAVVFGGQSRWEAIRNIRDALSTTGGNLGTLTNRAMTIERTGLIQVFSIAQDHAYRQALEELPDLRVTWLSARDRRVDPKCVAMDGKTKHPRGTFPGGVIAPPLHPRCLVAGTVVASPKVLATSERRYVGDVVEIRTAAGHVLTVTPNHPILTPNGWLAAGSLYEGCDVVSSPDAQRLAATVSPDEYHGPAVIEQIVRSFDSALTMASITMPTAPKDFHGDGGGSEVCVVRSNGRLWNALDASLSEPFLEQEFARVDMETEPLASLSRSTLRIEAIRSAALGGMSSLDSGHTGFRRAASLLKSVGVGQRSSLYTEPFQSGGDGLARNGVALAETLLRLASEIQAYEAIGVSGFPSSRMGGNGDLLQSAADRYARAAEASLNGRATYTFLSGDFSKRSPRLVTRDQAVEVRRIPGWDGHVYNLETSLGWYAANGIITHNCRCRMIASLPDWPPMRGLS